MRKLILLVALAAIAVLAPAGAASAQRDGSPDDPRAKAFVKEVSVDRVEHHQQRLQEIATANGGTRDIFGPGYTGSLNYVVRVLRNAGYEIFALGWTLRGLRIAPAGHGPLAAAYEAPSYIATLSADEIQARCAPAGWMTLRRSYAEKAGAQEADANR